MHEGSEKKMKIDFQKSISKCMIKAFPVGACSDYSLLKLYYPIHIICSPPYCVKKDFYLSYEVQSKLRKISLVIVMLM